MRFTTLTLLSALGASLAAALPTDLTEFFLVTSEQANPSTNSSQLRGVHATTPYAEDPVSQSTLLLRLIGPGYNSLPNFTLADGVLSTITSGPHGIGKLKYNSATVTEGAELQFVAQKNLGGNVGLDGGYLLTVGGESEGWTICDSASGQDVLFWKGTGVGCVPTYLHAVREPPYRR